MKKLCLLFLLSLSFAAAFAGCTSDARGDREFSPGRGWEPVE